MFSMSLAVIVFQVQFWISTLCDVTKEIYTTPAGVSLKVFHSGNRDVL